MTMHVHPFLPLRAFSFCVTDFNLSKILEGARPESSLTSAGAGVTNPIWLVSSAARVAVLVQQGWGCEVAVSLPDVVLPHHRSLDQCGANVLLGILSAGARGH